MECSPAPHLHGSIRRALWHAAVALASRAGYVGAGTCEFLLAPDATFGFIEMNARLQVEHPVTEMVTGLDLVELQLRVASGERLPLTQDAVRVDGHAIEVRVYAEDPAERFLPQTGRVLHLRWPSRARVDTGIEVGSDVTADYDPLLAKVIVHGADREEALARARRALAELEIEGVATTRELFLEILEEPAFRSGRYTTAYLDESRAALPSLAEAVA
jgi:acetyl/propionyl-CoA carboxylase alpha subunit